MLQSRICKTESGTTESSTKTAEPAVSAAAAVPTTTGPVSTKTGHKLTPALESRRSKVPFDAVAPPKNAKPEAQTDGENNKLPTTEIKSSAKMTGAVRPAAAKPLRVANKGAFPQRR